MHTTLTNVLLEINGEFVLANRFYHLTKRFLSKTIARHSHPLLTLLSRFIRLFVEDRKDKLGYVLLYYNTLKAFLRQVETLAFPDYLNYSFLIRFLEIPVDIESGLGSDNPASS